VRGLSYRDVEELLAERGITVDHVTVYRSVQRFTRSSSRLQGLAATLPATAGSSMRPT
jgi:transposase-like protein